MLIFVRTCQVALTSFNICVCIMRNKRHEKHEEHSSQITHTDICKHTNIMLWHFFTEIWKLFSVRIECDLVLITDKGNQFITIYFWKNPKCVYRKEIQQIFREQHYYSFICTDVFLDSPWQAKTTQTQLKVAKQIY